MNVIKKAIIQGNVFKVELKTEKINALSNIKYAFFSLIALTKKNKVIGTAATKNIDNN
jgi:hypothetical protein